MHASYDTLMYISLSTDFKKNINIMLSTYEAIES